VFAAPPVIETTIFARLPDSLRARANPRQQSGVPRDSFLEGPSFDRAGNLYVVNIPYGQVLRGIAAGRVCGRRGMGRRAQRAQDPPGWPHLHRRS